MKNFRTVLILSAALGLAGCPTALAQVGKVGGGAKPSGARPSMGNIGTGGARPNMSKPSVPNMARPNYQRPMTPQPLQPSLGNAATRPANPSFGNVPNKLPSVGGSRPSLGMGGFPQGKPPVANPTVPSKRPGVSQLPNRPNDQQPNRPTTLPSRPNVSQPPSLPSVKPPASKFPTTRPSDPPGTTTLPGSKPSLGNVNRPTTLPARPEERPGNLGGKPTTLPGNVNRPVIGGSRPGGNGSGNDIAIRPGGVSRPNIDVSNRPNINIGNRPSIGIGNRPNIGNNTNINIGNNVIIGNRYPNRPNWDIDPGFSRPSWGLGGGDWHHHWHNNCINVHHHWYNGCWHGYWGSSWYAPVVWGGIGWGLGAIANGWGVTYSSYYNPYYSAAVVNQYVPYDYSKPVVISNYISTTDQAQGGNPQNAAQTQQQQSGLELFDQGLAKFKAGQYIVALNDFNRALEQLPEDPVVHEVRALALYATGDYKAAAASLNSLLSSAPGMDWTTMSGLYGNPSDYQNQLRKLEQFCKSNRNDASASFVLAYHYLVIGSKDAAINALTNVIKNQPRDITAQRMLEALVPPKEQAATTPEAPQSESANESQGTDLVGRWVAESGGTRIELVVTEDSRFTWKASPKDGKPVELAGQLVATFDGISLETKEQGTMGGAVESKGPDNWTFTISGSPPSAPGLSFVRVK